MDQISLDGLRISADRVSIPDKMIWALIPRSEPLPLTLGSHAPAFSADNLSKTCRPMYLQEQPDAGFTSTGIQVAGLPRRRLLTASAL